MKKVGMYLWGGPGIVDLLKVKYPTPKIDEMGHMVVYDDHYLSKAKEILGVTDLWVTYSWGFNDGNESTHHEFIKKRLGKIKELGFQVHGYVQGFNLVTEDFKNQDIFCRDHENKLLPYSRGRSFICPNNPKALLIIKNRVEQACQLPFDGIFMDNIIFGLSPVYVSKHLTSFFGCSCNFCKEKFLKQYGYDLPVGYKNGKNIISDYLEFRSKSILNTLREIQKITKSKNKKFGVNLYDFTRHNSKLYFGYELHKIDPLLDYYLIENHAISSKNTIDNSRLSGTISKSKKPVFVLSYKNGIGCEKGYSQTEIDLIFSESEKLGYHPCIKGSEYRTKGIWHVLELDKLKKPNISNQGIRTTIINNKKTKSKMLSKKYVLKLSDNYPKIMRFMYNNSIANNAIHRSGIYKKVIRSIKDYDL